MENLKKAFSSLFKAYADSVQSNSKVKISTYEERIWFAKRRDIKTAKEA